MHDDEIRLVVGMEPIRVFISSRLNLSNERRWAKDAVRSMGSNFEPILFEEEPADTDHIREWWRRKISDSEFLILILGEELSAAVFDEFKTAEECATKIFVFLKYEGRIKDKEIKVINFHEKDLVISEKDLKWFFDTLATSKYKRIKNGKQFKKDIKDAISLKLEVSDDFSEELKRGLLKDYDPDLQKIKEVYVKPVAYAQAERILKEKRILIITGPPNIGKTSMAYYLSNAAKNKTGSPRIIKVDEHRISDLQRIKDSVILFDDAFGKTTLGDSVTYENEFDEILKIRENSNYVVLTTRKEILEEAKKQVTRFAPYYPSISDCIFEIEQEGSYSDGNLEEILKNHLEFYSKNQRITEEEVVLATKNKNMIVSSLRFPHNYEVLVKEELRKVVEGKIDVASAISNAKHIKKWAYNWFSNLDISKKYFVFTLALFPNLSEKTFNEIYESFVDALKETHTSLQCEDLDVLRKDASSYVTEFGDVNFRHSSYWEGIRDGMEKRFKKDMISVLPNLRSLATHKSWRVRRSVAYSVIKLAQIKPDESLLILKELASDRKWRVRRATACPLRKIAEERPGGVLSILDELVDDENWRVRLAIIYPLQGISQLTSDEALSILRTLSKDKKRRVRKAALYHLRKVCNQKSDKVFHILKELVNEENWYTRKAVIHPLRKFTEEKPDEVLFILKKLVNDANWHVRKSSIHLLKKLAKQKPDEVIQLLEKLTKDENDSVQNLAASVLNFLKALKERTDL